jgi:hypothetical protein
MTTDLIKETIISNYIHGAFHETNINAFRKIFPAEFSIISLQEDGKLFFFTREMWENVLQKRKGDAAFDYAGVEFTATFRTIDVEGNKAAVTLDLNLSGKKIYTDFLLLIYSENEWKIVSKIYHQHNAAI